MNFFDFSREKVELDKINILTSGYEMMSMFCEKIEKDAYTNNFYFISKLKLHVKFFTILSINKVE